LPEKRKWVVRCLEEIQEGRGKYLIKREGREPKGAEVISIPSVGKRRWKTVKEL